jgi:riboflavin synthase
MPETKRKSTFNQRQTEDLVNLELAMLANGRFDGHIVQGHVDATGKILDIQKDGNAYLMKISLPENIKPYCIPQGSITINGISFTIARLEKNSFSIGIIPHTWKVTNLHQTQIGDRVNLEGDILGKYLVRFRELNK